MTRSIDELAGRAPVRAREPGTLEAARTVLDLPELTPVVGRTATGEPDGVVRGWLTHRVVDGESAWRRWARAFDRTGPWPLHASGFERSPLLALPAAPADAATVLEACWQGCRPVRPDGTLVPHPPWPGLAPARGAPDRRGVVLPRELCLPLPGQLLLVPARRPADTLAHLGWYGAVNWSLSGAQIAGVLRSWEERFGAYVVAIGSATLDVIVTRPPATARQLDLLAHERFAFAGQLLPADRADGVADLARGVRSEAAHRPDLALLVGLTACTEPCARSWPRPSGTGRARADVLGPSPVNSWSGCARCCGAGCLHLQGSPA